MSQNGKGHILGHVKDLGRSIDDPTARIYQTTHRQTRHTDSADIVALLCLKTAKAGGLSRIVGLGACFSPAWRGPASAYPRRIHVVTSAAAHDGAPYVGRRGSICCGPFLPWAGIWKRCQMFTANASGGRRMVVGRPPREARREPNI